MRYLITIILVFHFAIANAGGGWTHEEGNGYFKLSTYIIKANQHYTDNGSIDPNITIGFSNTSLYLEYGLKEKWTLIGNISLFARNFHNSQVSNTTGEIIMEGEAINGIGDIDLAVKYGIYKNDKIAIAASALFGIPTGKTGKGSLGVLQLGDGEFNQQIRIDVSNPFRIKNSQLYTNLYVGFNNRTKGFSEEFKWGAEFGVGLIKGHLWLIGKLDGVTSFKNGKIAADVNSSSIFANNTEYISFAIEAAGKLYKGFGLTFNYSGAFFARNIFASPAYTVGVFYDLK